jgi:two-component system, NtrC family, nitrogen regulation response regulator GlnG
MRRPYSVLVADDDQSIRTIVSQTLERAGYNVIAVGSAAALWHQVERGEGDVVVTDVLMPDADGIDLLPKIQKQRPGIPIIVMSAQNTLATAVRATANGAYEYLPKPFDINTLTDVVNNAIKNNRGARKKGRIIPDTPLVGRSAAMQELYRTMARLMRSELTVLIQGESGTGKELVARALHDMGKRKSGPFVPVNMAAIPKELIESELFGHEKGAFTGAEAKKAGRFEEALGGTLFLDEIGDMPIEAQTRLLRVLQQGEFRTIGGKKQIRADIRILAATNQPLERLVQEGRFREDLYYRLNVVPLNVPPLRDRKEDISDLVTHFLEDAQADGLPPKELDEGALDALLDHNWPGNVRELENFVRRLCALYSENVIDTLICRAEIARIATIGRPWTKKGDGLSDSVHDHLSRYFAAHAKTLPPEGLYGRVIKEVERPLIELCLKATNGNQIRTAKILGLNRNTLRKKIIELRIKPRPGK